MNIMGLFLLAPGQLEFLIIGVGYFTKWIEVEVIAKITIERVRCFYWKKNCAGMDLLDLSSAIMEPYSRVL